MPKDIDKISRDKIRTETGSNFFVEAGAGAGKTTLLVDRMAAMIESGIDISRIAAITFTKAAAMEFYERFQAKLAESSSPAAAKALRSIDLCFMGTIDSFCNMVLSEHPAEAGIPSNAGIIMNDELSAVYAREYSRILKGEGCSEELHEKAAVFSSYFRNGRDMFVSGMKFLNGAASSHFNHPEVPEGTIDEIFRDDKARIVRMLQYLIDHKEIVRQTPSPAASLKAFNDLEDCLELISGTWNEDPVKVMDALKEMCDLRLIPEAMKHDVKYGPDFYYFFAEHGKKKIDYLVVNPDTDPFRADALKGYLYALTADFMSGCAGNIAEKLRSEGSLTFSDNLLFLRDLLKKDAAGSGDLIKHIYERHSYFLIDEFQDTNPLQSEIFFYLTAKEPDPDWRKCVPKPGSLFIVGDPKQSIYRFSNADVSSFLRVRKMFDDPEVGEILTLTRNHRSCDVLCSWFNRTFGELLSDESDIQSRFSDIPTGEKPPYKAGIQGAFYYDVEKPADGAAAKQYLSDIILKMMGDPGVTIQDRGKDARPRRPEFKDFMVITAEKKNGLGACMKEFSERGIPFRAEGKILFNECRPLKALAMIYGSVADTYDRKAEFSAEKISGCGLSREDIQEYAKKARVMTPASVFKMLLDDGKIFARAGADHAEYVYYALELLRSAETDGSVSTLKEAAAFLEMLVSNESGAERCIQLNRDSNRVHLANLHKVKGLQAPIVILADHQGVNHNRYGAKTRIDYTADPPQSWIFSIGKTASKEYDAEKEKENEVLDCERTRLLYVAATRAENVLVAAALLGKNGNRQDSSPWLPLVERIDDNIFDAIGGSKAYEPVKKQSKDANKLYDKAGKRSVMNDRAGEEASYSILRPSSVNLKGKTSAEDDYEDKAEDLKEQKKGKRKGRADALIAGTTVHRLMEVLVSSDNKADLEAAVTEIISDYGEEAAHLRDTLLEVGKTVRSGGFEQSNGSPKDILSELLSADEVHCELPFCFRESEDRIWHGSMDVVYCKDGKWHILDYKTNADPDDLDEHYRAQLSAYINAFREMTGEEADAMTYHIDISGR